MIISESLPPGHRDGRRPDRYQTVPVVRVSHVPPGGPPPPWLTAAAAGCRRADAAGGHARRRMVAATEPGQPESVAVPPPVTDPGPGEPDPAASESP